MVEDQQVEEKRNWAEYSEWNVQRWDTDHVFVRSTFRWLSSGVVRVLFVKRSSARLTPTQRTFSVFTEIQTNKSEMNKPLPNL